MTEPNPSSSYLLCECIDAYIPLEEPQLSEFESQLHTEPFRRVLEMRGTTMFGQAKAEGWRDGREAGRVEGQRKVLRELLQLRFGPLSPSTLAWLDGLTVERMDTLLPLAIKASSLAELAAATKAEPTAAPTLPTAPTTGEPT